MSILHPRVYVNCSLERILDHALGFSLAVFHELANKALSAFLDDLPVLLSQLLDQGVLVSDGQLSRAHRVRAGGRVELILLGHL